MQEVALKEKLTTTGRIIRKRITGGEATVSYMNITVMGGGEYVNCVNTLSAHSLQPQSLSRANPGIIFTGSRAESPEPEQEQEEDTQKEQSQEDKEVEEPAKVEGHEVTLDREEAHKVTQDGEEIHEVTQEREEPHEVAQDKKEKMNLSETAQVEELEESGEQVYMHTCG